MPEINLKKCPNTYNPKQQTPLIDKKEKSSQTLHEIQLMYMNFTIKN